ncbi:hypothetical protein C0584_02350 [Candidatus Parcubacteria bacterium]|nr:MAG: hypothetical protein C0584_02350 [Candidatus Parcubacteria bacterium]
MNIIISTSSLSIQEGIDNLDSFVESVKLSNPQSDFSEKIVRGSFFSDAVFKSDRGTFLLIRRI